MRTSSVEPGRNRDPAHPYHQAVDATSSLERYPEPEKHLASTSSGGPRVVLLYEETNKPERVSICAGSTVGTGLGWVDAKIPWSSPSVFLASGLPSPDQDVKNFGELELAKRQDEILPALQIVEPRLVRISLVPLAGELILHGDIGLPRLVPLPFMGEGVARVLSIMLAIANAPAGVVLIDEIENGLHYTALKQVWQALAQAARRLNVQVFATTHSWECIRSAHVAFKEQAAYELRYFRLDRDNGAIAARSFDKRHCSMPWKRATWRYVDGPTATVRSAIS